MGPKHAMRAGRDSLCSKTVLSLIPLLIFANSGISGLFLGIIFSITLLITGGTLALFGGNYTESTRVGAKVLLAGATATFADLLLQAYFIGLYPSLSFGVALVAVIGAQPVQDQNGSDLEPSFSATLISNFLLGLASTVILVAIGSTRAALAGSAFGFHAFWGIGIAAMPPGALLLTGLLLALKNYVAKPNNPLQNSDSPTERRVRVTGPIR